MPNLEVDPNAVPDDYIEEVYAVEDYTSTDEGGLSFSRGDRVYVLLRNRFGYCTGWSLFVADFYICITIILNPNFKPIDAVNLFFHQRYVQGKIRNVSRN